MPQLRELVLLLPDYELEGYPRHLPSDAAARLLSGWLGLWNPGFIAVAQSIPHWHAAGHLPDELAGSVFVLPEISSEHITDEMRQQIAESGAWLLTPTNDWRSMQVEIKQQVGECPQSDVSEELSELFAALGYAYLQIQLMTRQLRYSSNLDQTLFGEQACRAAEAALEGDRTKADQMLQACFDSLGQERDHYYSLDVHLLDVTLLAESTLGKSFEEQLDTPTTLVASAALLEKLEEKNPQLFERLKTKLACGELAIAGGLDRERPHPVMPHESAIRDLHRGGAAYRALGIEPPTVFARMSFGMQPESATILKRFGYDGVLLTAWAEGTYPSGNQVKLSWESSDGTFLPALAAPVIDAADPGGFLSLGWAVGDSLDNQHVPTLTFAHWPNRTCDYFQLLRLIVARTPAMGKWMLGDKYFKETDQPYHQERLSSDAFRMNWLADAVSPADWIERTKAVTRLQVRSRSLQNLLNLAFQLEESRNATSAIVQDGEAISDAKVLAMPFEGWAQELPEINDTIDSAFDEGIALETTVELAESQLNLARKEVLDRLQQKLSGKSTGNAVGGRLILNPYTCANRYPVHTDAEQSLDTEAEWHFASGRVGSDRVSCVDVPSMGFVASPIERGSNATLTKAPVVAVASGLLQNEFMEAQIDTQRGHLKSIHVPSRRGNRLSVMLARRQRTEKGDFSYTEMVATDVRMITSSNVCGIVRAVGRLVVKDRPTGEFEIDYELWRGSRVLEVNLRLSQLQALTDTNPWRSAYVLRVAWPSEAAILRHWCGTVQRPWGGGRCVAPELIEIDETDYRTHFLTGGLAFHRRTEMRFLETIVACGSQASASHTVGFGMDLPSPLLAARRFQDRKYEIAVEKSAPASSGWLISVDVRNVVLDLQAPLVNEDGQMVGLRVIASETTGKSTSAKLRFWREAAAAHRVDYLGNRLGKLTVDGERVVIAMRANEQILVDVLWKV